MNALTTTIEFIAQILWASDMQGKRDVLDTFADRLSRATSEPTLAQCMEHLLRTANASPGRIHPPLVAQMIAVSGADEGPRILRWLRSQTRLAVMLAALRDEKLRAEAIASVTLPQAETDGQAIPRGAFDITIAATCTSPLSHGAEGKAGNATLFRRIDVVATNGAMLRLPYYSGNALRGQMRDLLADHFLRSLGLPADRDKPAIALWFFYAIYAGGALEERSEATKAMAKQLGDYGAIRSDGIRTWRTMLPALSLLGCALGNRVLPGHCQFADLRPVCHEWGTGDTPVAELMTWEYLTRREDHEDHEEHHGMIANTECLRAGTKLEGGIDHDSSMKHVELSALGLGLGLLQKRGKLGAENRRGLGAVQMEITGATGPEEYETYLADHKAEILDYLRSIEALA